MSEIDELEQTPAEDADTVQDEGSPAPAEQPEQQDTPRKYAGKYESPDELEKAHVELQRKLGEQGEELGRLKTLIATPYPPAPYPGYPATAQYQAPTAPAEPEIPVTDEDFYANPKAALTKVYAKAKTDAVEEARKAIREETTRAAQLNQLEAQFYSANKDLDPKKDKPLVNYYAEELQREMATLNPYQRQQLYPDPMKEVARRTRDHKADLLNEARTKQQTTQPLHVGPGGGVASAPASTAPAKPNTAEERHKEYMAELRAFTRS
jgi:hypothetical protein